MSMGEIQYIHTLLPVDGYVHYAVFFTLRNNVRRGEKKTCVVSVDKNARVSDICFDKIMKFYSRR